MQKIFVVFSVAVLLLGLAGTAPAMAQELPWQEPGTGANLFNAGDLDNLLAPIALYPDPLLAQMLPAATFVDQIDEAARFVRMYGVTPEIEAQDWDVSVKAVAHYPEVLFMMDQRADWTAALGQAYINQEAAVMNAIQRLRAEAMAEGNLVSTPQQQVIVSGGIISIVPAVPDIIYVPVYDPQVVYFEPPPPASMLVYFGTGFLIGAWLNRDFDWHRHRIYYHGWEGGGWIGRARPHIHRQHNIYVNPRDHDIRVDRRVMRRDTLRYRQDIRNRAPIIRRNQPISRPAQRTFQRQSPPKPNIRVPSGPPPRVEQRQRGNENVYRGRDLQRREPESQTGYGGYGSRSDALRYHDRGRSSQESMRTFRRRPEQQHIAPTPRSGQKPAVHPPPRQTPNRRDSRDDRERRQ